jgi:NAD+ synthase (glutamine-hydrolysing)
MNKFIKNGLPLLYQNRIYNTVCLLIDGIHYKPRWFHSWANDADIILNPSASHFAFHKHRVRERFVLEGSRSFSVSYIYTNLLGNEAGRAIYDGDAMIARF